MDKRLIVCTRLVNKRGCCAFYKSHKFVRFLQWSDIVFCLVTWSTHLSWFLRISFASSFLRKVSRSSLNTSLSDLTDSLLLLSGFSDIFTLLFIAHSHLSPIFSLFSCFINYCFSAIKRPETSRYFWPQNSTFTNYFTELLNGASFDGNPLMNTETT